MNANFNIFRDKSTPVLMLSYMLDHSPPAFLSLTHLAFSHVQTSLPNIYCRARCNFAEVSENFAIVVISNAIVTEIPP